jgi:uncharacterized membrane protein
MGGRLFYLHLARGLRALQLNSLINGPFAKANRFPSPSTVFFKRRVAMADEPNAAAASTGLSDNAAGAIAYLTVIPAIIFLIVEPYNKNSFVRFNSWQCIFLCCAAIVLDIAFGILLGIITMMFPLAFFGVFLWPIVNLFWLVVVVLCAVNAYQGKRFKLPIIGALAEKQAGA